MTKLTSEQRKLIADKVWADGFLIVGKDWAEGLPTEEARAKNTVKCLIARYDLSERYNKLLEDHQELLVAAIATLDRLGSYPEFDDLCEWLKQATSR